MMIIKYFYTLFLLFAIVSCNQTQNNTIESFHTDTILGGNISTSSDPLIDYQLFLSKLDTLNVETATSAAKKYQELFNNEEDKIKDKGLRIFNDYYERLDKNLNELHTNNTTNFDPFVRQDAGDKKVPIPQKLQDYNNRLKENGFQVATSEGMSYIKPDRDFFSKWFYNSVSVSMKEYLQQLNKESKEGFAVDAGLIIGEQQYVDRLVWWDNFIHNNPDFLMVNEAKEHRKTLLTFFITGMDNSPLLDYETKKLNDYFKNAYTYLQTKYLGSETNKIVNPYFKALLQNGKTKVSALLVKYKQNEIIIDFGKNH